MRGQCGKKQIKQNTINQIQNKNLFTKKVSEVKMKYIVFGLFSIEFSKTHCILFFYVLYSVLTLLE